MVRKQLEAVGVVWWGEGWGNQEMAGELSFNTVFNKTIFYVLASFGILVIVNFADCLYLH